MLFYRSWTGLVGLFAGVEKPTEIFFTGCWAEAD